MPSRSRGFADVSGGGSIGLRPARYANHQATAGFRGRATLAIWAIKLTSWLRAPDSIFSPIPRETR